MTTDTSVKYFDSSMSGAPALSNTAGTLISVLDACLVNGFGSMALTSLVIAGNVATATKNGHGFVMRGSTGPVIVISGATPAELNTEFRIQSIPDANTFTFTTSGIADQAATGTISAKRAPAGFSKAFSGTNKGAYQSNDITGTQLFLRVDDAYTTYNNARLRGYESIADQTAFDNDTATGPFPTDAQSSGGLFVYKASSTGRSWTIFSDGKIIYFFCDSVGNGSWNGGFCFGDVDSYIVSDAYCSLLVGATSINAQSSFYFLSNTAHYMARAKNQAGASITPYKYTHSKTTTMGNGGDTYDNASLILWPIDVWDSATVARGLLPGCWNPIATSVPHGDTLPSIPQLAGRTLLTQKMFNSYSCAIDITGPWR